ncbi:MULTISPECIES: abortive infection family protein [Flavobacterium]|uniref:Abortive infection family protein n=1 Tax=Flavobacterium jumunjinense TaxID=998845 RepID=A0ABV5GK01_9FLAO|nr:MULTISPECIES: abortive infection family protein [Flavobacterium]
MEIISKKTRSEFKEYFVTITLREIENYFDNHDVQFTEHSDESNYGGQRRTLVENYYIGIDWRNPIMCRKILNVYQDILNDLEDNKFTWNTEQNKIWFDKLSKFLLRDGFEFSNGELSSVGQIVNFEDLQNATDLLDKSHFQEHIDRIKKSITEDVGLAIGSTKELVESTLKTILNKSKISFDKKDDIPKLLKSVQKALELVPDDVDDAKKGSDIIKILLSNLSQVVIKLTELRNLYGTGHGKENARKGLNERHAKLAVGAGITLATFLLETFEHRRLK